MGLNIANIIPRMPISFQELKGKTIIVDASNVIYHANDSVYSSGQKYQFNARRH